MAPVVPCAGPDGDGDCSESCNETQNDCNGSDANGAPCDDGLFCNGTDGCTSGNCGVHYGNPCPGHDVGPDCDDSCDETSDNCSAWDAPGTPWPGGICIAGWCDDMM